ncbi:MAG: hypothetical protein AB1449_10705 [Chloroflexota bacterium]
MTFNSRRRGQLVSRAELVYYTRTLPVSVMDGLTYFIGHRIPYPASKARYLAVSGAHVSHMLRDAVDDAQAGYYNIPREAPDSGRIAPTDFDSSR